MTICTKNNVICISNMSHVTFEAVYPYRTFCFSNAFCFILQRDPAEEALKSNNMNLDQAMSKFTASL